MSRFSIPPDHPSLPGHFPGRPVVPGVVLLEEILALLAPEGAAALPQIRFLRPVLPGETVELRGTPDRFEALVGDTVVLRGSLVPR